ncbi:thioredoxin-dependent thiol peroxidase [Kiloniella laminariae]|uniref:thioredoxin-dependent peroxiredoxin n=1 Tax=Kiloniella laminariae TaxID=454162 RepID=A0ABT4LEC3_9PROT|nr:thioredoxin-dependent thiol peroxidase [Kiloniella laminariae]MCZ4279445.1 thioredoxin-dependent thiol peroxidase [Kiloniella laminariae]
MSLETGDKAPDFTAPLNGGDELTLSSLQGQNVVLYFYPKDSTPGCTTEACDFRDALADFSRLNARVIGVSKDSVKRHDNFIAKNELNFPLVSDETGAICEAYGVWILKKLYGKEYMGIERATFLIDARGVIRQIWHKVKVSGHVKEVQEAVASL